MLDITMTACRRPEILEQTLSSFHKNLFGGVDCSGVRLIMNVDPAGQIGVGLQDMVDVAKKYFPFLIARMPREASFPKAFIWVWSIADSEYILNLEDDWELVRPVDLTRMIKVMEKYPNLASLRLPFRPLDKHHSKNWKFIFPWNGDYFECPRDLQKPIGFCGHPSLLRGDFVQRCAPLLDDERNPEKQFHGGIRALDKEVEKWRFGVFGEPNQSLAVRDIGRQWMVKNGLRKAGCKAFFTVWEKAE